MFLTCKSILQVKDIRKYALCYEFNSIPQIHVTGALSKKKSIDRISFFKKKQVTVNTSECYKLLTTELPNLSCRFLRCNLCIILVKQTCATFAS